MGALQPKAPQLECCQVIDLVEAAEPKAAFARLKIAILVIDGLPKLLVLSNYALGGGIG